MQLKKMQDNHHNQKIEAAEFKKYTMYCTIQVAQILFRIYLQIAFNF